MAKTKQITIGDEGSKIQVTLQSVSPSWYYNINDKYGMTGGKKQSSKYMDELIKNCVAEPAEIRSRGMDYFDELEDLAGAEELNRAIESFLRGRE